MEVTTAVEVAAPVKISGKTGHTYKFSQILGFTK